MSLETELKEYAKSIGIPLLGIGSPERMKHAPYGMDPEVLLPGAKAVVAFGLPALKGTMSAFYTAEDTGNEQLRAVYGRYGRGSTNAVTLMYATWAISQWIERKHHYVSVPTMTGPWSISRTLSHRYAAVAAGLGEMGYQNAVITPEYGPRVRWGAIVTNMPLAADPLYSGEKLCDPEKCGYACVNLCPNAAISREETEKCVIGEYEREIASVNFARCRAQCMGIADRVDPDASPEEVQKEVNRIPYEPGRMFRADTYLCDRCIGYCPAGKDYGNYVNAGFTGKADQIRRIMHFEEIFDRIDSALKAGAKDELKQLRPQIEELRAYYSGADWRKDYEDDEAGLIPGRLKRGVLSEDAVYDLLDEIGQTE